MKIIDVGNGFIDLEGEPNLEKGYYWILADVVEIESVNKFMSIDEESLEACKNLSKNARINFFQDYIFLILNVLTCIKDVVVSKELNVFLGKGILVTLFRGNMNILNKLMEDIKESKNCLALKEKPKVAIILYYILDRIIIKNYSIISELEAKADKIEINVLKNPERDYLYDLITLRRQVYKVRKYLNPLIYIGDSLILNENLIIEDDSLKYFTGLNRKIEKLKLSLESLVQDLALVRETFESETANRTNELMKIFTVITSIFLPLNLITSMYGMNLKGIPFMELENGCHYVVLFMSGIAIFLIFIFRKNKWI